MKTKMNELLDHFVDAWSSPSDYWIPSKVIDKVELMIKEEKEQQLDLIRFIRLNDKMGKSVEDLYNEFYN